MRTDGLKGLTHKVIKIGATSPETGKTIMHKIFVDRIYGLVIKMSGRYARLMMSCGCINLTTRAYEFRSILYREAEIQINLKDVEKNNFVNLTVNGEEIEGAEVQESPLGYDIIFPHKFDSEEDCAARWRENCDIMLRELHHRKTKQILYSQKERLQDFAWLLQMSNGEAEDTAENRQREADLVNRYKFDLDFQAWITYPQTDDGTEEARELQNNLKAVNDILGHI